ncbi:Hypothetical protein CINCED_3A022807 [Cinara cedri]|uniref:Uncharacterized protein n=1 Tax=Cinara cedri TaxID=506608 RepID=A0A5E4NEA0_9HEMI|nr:Hypothetical protein CINCED_3A022807 [Cinara cedri]
MERVMSETFEYLVNAPPAARFGSGSELVWTQLRLACDRVFRPILPVVRGLFVICASAAPVTAHLVEFVLNAAIDATESGKPPKCLNVRAAYGRLAACLAVATLLGWLYSRFLIGPVLRTAVEFAAFIVRRVPRA